MKKGNLLIVDDEPLILKTLRRSLEEYVDAVFTALNGKEALSIFEQNEIHCIVCDINMPVMNGVEFIKTIREMGSSVPFIFFTAYNEKELMLKAVKYGAFDFLTKPNFEGLEEIVSRGLREGFKNTNQRGTSEQEILSEYHKLLKGLE